MISIFGSVALTGIVGSFFIDNAGHLGGVLTGMAVAMATVPAANQSANEEFLARTDRWGWIASGVLAIGAVFTAVRLMR